MALFRVAGLPRGPRHELLATRSDETHRGRARRPRERRRGRVTERRARLRDGHAPRLSNDAADGRGARRVRRQRRRARASGARDPARHRRERAEPEPLLAPAVRARRDERRAGGVPRAAHPHLRRAEGRLTGRTRLRRRALAARRRPRGRHAPTHSPTKFIQELGVAYRASGRDRPVMDALSIHPYPDNSSQPPTTAHPNTTTIGIADYDKLVALLGQAFDGTAQPGSAAPDPVRRVRRRVADPGPRRRRSTRATSRR